MANLIGSGINQIPTNGMLGNLAFQDKAYVNVDAIGIGSTFVDSGTVGQQLQVTGSAYVSGSVGIGTTNPTVTLQLSPNASISNVGFGITLAGTVGSALTVAQFLYANTNTSYLRIKATRFADGTSWTTASTKLLTVTDVTEQGYIEYNPSGSTSGMAFGSGATELVRLTSTGNLGIGVTNPLQKFEVSGTSRFLTSGQGDVIISHSSLVSTIRGAATVQLALGANNSEAIRINTSGFVGIGTTNPSGQLHVNGTRILHSLSGINTVEFGYGAGSGDTNAYGLFVPNGRNFYLYANNTFQLSGTSTGVGIGTTNPGATLNVVPTATSIAGLFSGTTSSDMVRITQLGTGNALVVEDSANPDSSPFVVTGIGSVGIGTASPAFTADIAGDARVTSTNKMRFGGTAGTTNFYIQYNSTTNSLDFVAG